MGEVVWQEEKREVEYVLYTKEEILKHPDCDYIKNLCYMVDSNSYSGPPASSTKLDAAGINHKKNSLIFLLIFL